MKTILAVGFLFFVAGMAHSVDQQVLDAIKEHMESCAKELQITPEEEEVIVNNENLDDEMKAKSGCYYACLLKHLELIENGAIKPENIQSATEIIYSHAPEMIPQQVEEITRCSEKVTGITDECEIGYELINCLK